MMGDPLGYIYVNMVHYGEYMMSGTWQSLADKPSFNVGTMLLLTDGTVLCQNSGNGRGNPNIPYMEDS